MVFCGIFAISNPSIVAFIESGWSIVDHDRNTYDFLFRVTINGLEGLDLPNVALSRCQRSYFN